MPHLLRRAINHLIASGFSSAEVADALGVTDSELRSLRATPAFSFLDEAPDEWYRTLADMAWERGGLERLAHELEQV